MNVLGFAVVPQLNNMHLPTKAIKRSLGDYWTNTKKCAAYASYFTAACAATCALVAQLC